MATGPLAATMQMEVETARLMIDAPGRAVLVVGITLQGIDSLTARSLTVPLSRVDGPAFAAALRREANRIEKMATQR